ncbi:MAG: dephospho-CoA kinase [Candidatus Omnitrophica bacterium]|nr:dephospho-CoA kinase [Candidatus Omnitrophota bacterium]
MFVIGVTGSLGTGKSTVAALLAELGGDILDADKMARQTLHRRGSCFKAVVGLLGAEILRDGTIDRKKVAGIVFNDPKKLTALEKIIHPAVGRVIREKIKAAQKSTKVFILDVPLLFEAGIDKICDLVVVVAAKKDIQVTRAMKSLRISEEEAKLRAAAQMPLTEKIRRADVKIYNNQTINQLRVDVKKLWKKIQPELGE